MKKIFLFMYLMCIFLVGCSKKQYKEDAVLVSVNGENNNVKLYNLYSLEKYNLQKYEDENSCYTGIFIEQPEGNFINEFENYMGSELDTYMYNLKLGEGYPLSFVLNCYSNLKVPFINILPPENSKDIFDNLKIKNMAKDFGNLQVPMFVSVYPLDKSFMQKKDEYVSFLQQAKKYFDIYAPNVAFVWTVNSNMVYKSKEFYIGDNYLDWIGININEDINQNSKLDIVFDEYYYFYKMYSDKKPIVINLAISHFSNTTHNYNIDDKINEIDRYFNNVVNRHKRIKMINYINKDTFKSNDINKQNYLVTDNKKILNTYKNAIKNEAFINNFNFSDDKKEVLQEKNTNILVYKIDDEFYFDSKIFDYLKKDASVYKENIINNKVYYKVFEIVNKNSVTIDENNNKVILN